MINNKETEFEFSLIKKLFLNKNNLLNFKNSKNLMTEKSLNKCVDFINIKDYYDEEDENIPLITKEINNTIFGIINFIEKNKEKKYDNTIHEILKKYFMNNLYLFEITYKNIDLLNYSYNKNCKKMKLFNKLKGLNSNNENFDLLTLNLLNMEYEKDYLLFVKNKDFIINNQIFLSFVKHIIENNNEFVDMLNMNVNLKVINVFDEILKFKLKNNIILYPSPKKLSQITNSFSEILNEKLEFEKKSFKFFLKNDVNKLKNNEDYEHFINITINKITKGILENIFYTMCFVDDSLFNKFKEENLFKLFIDNYQSVFKYPIDDNKMSYNNMLTNIKNINNELMLNYPSLNVLDRLNHFTEILNDFKSVKSKKIKI